MKVIFKNLLIIYVFQKLYMFLYIAAHNYFQDPDWPYIHLIFVQHEELDGIGLIRTLIGAPLLETLLFCSLMLMLLGKANFSKLTKVLICASVFGAAHYPTGGMYAVGHTFFAGIIFTSVYIRLMETENENNALIKVAVIHSLFNVLGLLI